MVSRPVAGRILRRKERGDRAIKEEQRGRMRCTSDVDVKLGNTLWRMSCRYTRGGDTVAFVDDLRQCVVDLSNSGLFSCDGT